VKKSVMMFFEGFRAGDLGVFQNNRIKERLLAMEK
jgi:hypothetical protein